MSVSQGQKEELRKILDIPEYMTTHTMEQIIQLFGGERDQVAKSIELWDTVGVNRHEASSLTDRADSLLRIVLPEKVARDAMKLEIQACIWQYIQNANR